MSCVMCHVFTHSQADEAAATEFRSKYGFGKAPSTMAQRKISATVSLFCSSMRACREDVLNNCDLEVLGHVLLD